MVSIVPETSMYYPVTWQHPTLLEKQSKFPRYNMKCRGRHDTTVHEIFRIVSRFPCYFSCYITKKKTKFPHIVRSVHFSLLEFPHFAKSALQLVSSPLFIQSAYFHLIKCSLFPQSDYSSVLLNFFCLACRSALFCAPGSLWEICRTENPCLGLISLVCYQPTTT